MYLTGELRKFIYFVFLYCLGFLAGNVFDWGAKEVALLMEAGQIDFRWFNTNIDTVIIIKRWDLRSVLLIWRCYKVLYYLENQHIKWIGCALSFNVWWTRGIYRLPVSSNQILDTNNQSCLNDKNYFLNAIQTYKASVALIYLNSIIIILALCSIC